MCLLVFAWNVHPRYRLIFAGNRDEFHDRPTAPMAWWAEPQRILAGRDLQAGGTWLGLSKRGDFGVVTNYRELQRPTPGMPSRGGLITNYLNSSLPSARFLADLGAEADQYAGFNLLLADSERMHYASNRAEPFARALQAGVHGLSNHLLDTSWPKLARTRASFETLIATPEPALEDLLSMLADREAAPDHLLPDTGIGLDWERLLSAPFIVDDRYGTRCSTVLRIGLEGSVQVRERRFDRQGRTTGEDAFEWRAEHAE
ncbi:MAG TPA: NRDE family protein [Steroidobacteraceae bacterium]|nr:NRDE family protein [Steroidobacteraceae bacterium]